MRLYFKEAYLPMFIWLLIQATDFAMIETTVVALQDLSAILQFERLSFNDARDPQYQATIAVDPDYRGGSSLLRAI